MAPKFDNFSEFFPYYLAEHSLPICRGLHYEKNRPATFDYTWWSFLGDYKMYSLWATGRIDAAMKEALEKHGRRNSKGASGAA